MIRAARLLFLVVLAGGCAPQAAQQQAAPVQKVIRMPRNVVGGLRPAFGNLTLNVERTIDGKIDRYELFTRWTGDARVDVQSGESLIIQADTQQFRFKVLESGIYRDFQCEPRCIYDDRAYYPATLEQVKAIAAAQKVTVRLIGSKQEVEREFNELNFERFREFVAKSTEPVPVPKPRPDQPSPAGLTLTCVIASRSIRCRRPRPSSPRGH